MTASGRLAIVVAGALVLGVLGANGAGWYRTHDFYALYSGSRMLAAGQDPYDEVQWCAVTENTTPEAFDRSRDIAVCFMRYAYPLFTAVLLVPLGVLPLPVAASLWLAISLVLYIAGLRWSWLAVGGPAPWALAYVAIVTFSQPFALLLALGQMGGVLFALCAFVVYAETRRRERSGGAALAFTALKPNVLPLFGAALFVRAALRRRWTFVAASLATLALLLAASVVVRPDWIGEWLHELFGRQIAHSIEYATAWGLAAVDLHAPWAAPLLILALVAGVLLVGGSRLHEPVALMSVAIPISTFATPYAWSYDDLVLALPWALVLSVAARADVLRRRVLLALLLLVAVAGPWFLWAIATARHTESLTAVVPAATALLVASAVRLERGRP